MDAGPTSWMQFQNYLSDLISIMNWHQFFEWAKLNGKEIWRHPWLPKLPPTAVRVRVRSPGVAGLILTKEFMIMNWRADIMNTISIGNVTIGCRFVVYPTKAHYCQILTCFNLSLTRCSCCTMAFSYPFLSSWKIALKTSKHVEWNRCMVDGSSGDNKAFLETMLEKYLISHFSLRAMWKGLGVWMLQLLRFWSLY
jgi:hypothetical protein